MQLLNLKMVLLKFIYHETTMIIPLANAIFDDNLNIEKYFIKEKTKAQN